MHVQLISVLTWTPHNPLHRWRFLTKISVSVSDKLTAFCVCIPQHNKSEGWWKATDFIFVISAPELVRTIFFRRIVFQNKMFSKYHASISGVSLSFTSFPESLASWVSFTLFFGSSGELRRPLTNRYNEVRHETFSSCPDSSCISGDGLHSCVDCSLPGR